MSIPLGLDQICVNLFISLSNSWKEDLLSSIVPDYIILDIKEVFIPSSELDDKQIWGLYPDRVYSVKSGAKLTQGLEIKPLEKLSL